MSPSPLWHPFTQHKTFGPAIPIARAQGAYLYPENGPPLLDGISSWWVNTHGHCHPKIVQAVQAQAETLDQIIFAGFSHAPARDLATKLLARVRQSGGVKSDYVFLSDSGSTAVEVALKMAVGSFTHQGRPRTKILALEGGYHGDTFGAMSAGGRSVYNALYEPFLFDVHALPFPENEEGHHTIEALETYLQAHGHATAAFIFEPLIQGAGGMRLYAPALLKALCTLCEQYGIKLIADEVMTGFGRTGTFLACEQAGVAPDLLCLSKGLTGGFLPLGATLASTEIYQAFYHDDKARQFFHSSSFTGNPLSCSAALANLEIWDTEPVFDRIARIANTHKTALHHFSAHPHVENPRILGTILALDFKTPDAGYLSGMASQLYSFMLARGFLLRPLGNTVYILPPYCITTQELEGLYDSLEIFLDEHRT